MIGISVTDDGCSVSSCSKKWMNEWMKIKSINKIKNDMNLQADPKCSIKKERKRKSYLSNFPLDAC